jgi:hypothetical protein
MPRVTCSRRSPSRPASLNGANRVVVVAVPGNGTQVAAADLATGYDKMLAVEDVNIVVPLPVGINGSTGSPGDTGTIGSDIKNHVDDAKDNGAYRIAILGYETGVTRDPASLAAGIDSSRVMVAWPNRLEYFNGLLNQTQEVAGYYLAAAYAGRFAALDVQVPITRKQIRGFNNIVGAVLQTMTRTTKDAWSRQGVAVTEPNAQRGLIVRHGVTTDVTSMLTREVSLTRAKDAMILGCLQSIESAELIGSPIVPETAARLKGLIMGVLETYKSSDVIVDYSGLTVTQQSTDPSVMEVKFRYRPAYPLNYVLISFGIDQTTGTVTDVATDVVAA